MKKYLKKIITCLIFAGTVSFINICISIFIKSIIVSWSLSMLTFLSIVVALYEFAMMSLDEKD